VTSSYRMSLPPLTLETAPSEARSMLEDAKARLGFVPNMYANMAHAPGLLETYLLGYRRFREDFGFTPAEQEIVFLTVSMLNGCSYCTAAHRMLAAKKSGVPAEVLAALAEGRPIPDPRLRALAEFTRTLWRKRARLEAADAEPFLAAGYGERQILGVLLALAVKLLSNGANHLFQTEVDPAFRAFAEPPEGVPGEM